MAGGYQETSPCVLKSAVGRLPNPPDLRAVSRTTVATSKHEAGGTTTNTKAACDLGGPKAARQ
jgi:hypothetical protein